MLKFWRRRKTNSRREGCGFFLWTCLFFLLTCVFSCLFLLLNSALIKEFYERFAAQGPAFLRRPRVIQAVMFVGPVLMVFAEWWLIDLIVDLVTPKREPDGLADKNNEAKDR